MPARYYRRSIGILAVVVIAIVVALSDSGEQWTKQALDAGRELINQHPRAGLLIFVLLSALSAMAAFASSAIIVPIGVNAWGSETTAALLWTGWLLGGAGSYVIGRTFGLAALKRLTSRVKIDYYSSKVKANAGFGLVLLFQLAVPSEIPGYVLGAARYRFSVYFAALALAELPFAVGAVYLGRHFIERQYWPLIGIGLSGIALTMAALFFLNRKTKQ